MLLAVHYIDLWYTSKIWRTLEARAALGSRLEQLLHSFLALQVNGVHHNLILRAKAWPNSLFVLLRENANVY